MSGNEKKVPKRRFKEFENAEGWEQRKLGEVSSKIGSGKTPLGGEKAYKDYGICLIRSQNVNYGTVNFCDTVYINDETDEEMKNSRVLNGDVLLNITGASIGRSAVYHSFERANVNQHVCIIRPLSDEISPEFINLNLTSNNGQKQIDSSQAGGAREGLNFQQISKMTFLFPKIEEQEQIGVFFTNLDNLITIHQRKLEKMKALKKAYLTDMFPAEGERKPKLRLSGFTDDWEQRKLGDLSESLEYGLNAAAMKFDGKNKYIRITDIEDESREFLSVDLTSPNIDPSKAEKFKLQNGDIVFARTGASVGKSYIYKDSDGLVYYAGFLIRARIKCQYSAEFVFQNTLTDEYNKFIRITSQRSGQPGVNAQEYSEYVLKVPKFEEQTKIGTFFRNLDKLITLHQHKLEKLQNIKKAYLNEMFI